MNKIKFTKRELLQLELELNGGIVPDVNITYEGFLKQNLPLILKYELNDLSNYLINLVDEIKEAKENLILKYGKVDSKGNVMINPYIEVLDDNGNIISRKYDENFLNYNKEFNELIETEIEIEYPDIFLSVIKEMGHTKDDYRILFHLIKSN